MREIYVFDSFRLDPGHRRLNGPGDDTLALTAKPFDLLVYLVRNAGEPVSRNTLLHELWPDTVVEDNNLTQAISTLRSTLGKDYIITLPGRGYQFVGDVRTMDSEAGTHSDDPALTGPPQAPKRTRWVRVAAAAGVIAVVAIGIEYFFDDSDSPMARGPVLPNSIAILPLDNLSADPDNSYYAAGLHEEILNQLSRIGSLNVISRTSVLPYADTELPIGEIARELNVENIVAGSIRFAGDQIRVTTQLVDGRTGQQIWAQTYTSNFGDVFGVESNIAMNVANSLSLELAPEQPPNLLEAPTGSSAAYALYLRAWNTGGAPLATQNVELLDQALTLDPDFALAHALKALIHSRSLINIAGIEAADAADRGAIVEIVRTHATRAIEIDPRVPYAHAALGSMYRYQWYWTTAVEEYLQAVENMPSDLSARQGLAWSLGWLGRHEEAIEQALLGIELNPMNANALYYIAPVYAYAGQYDNAIESLRSAQQLIPTNRVVQAWLGFMATARRDTEVAIRELRLAEELMGGNPSTVFLPEFAHAYSLLGLEEDVQRIYAQILERAAADDSLGSGTWAQTYIAIGDYERALEWLEVIADKAENHIIDEATLNVLHLKMNYMDDPVLNEPRFVEVFRRIQGS